MRTSWVVGLGCILSLTTAAQGAVERGAAASARGAKPMSGAMQPARAPPPAGAAAQPVARGWAQQLESLQKAGAIRTERVRQAMMVCQRSLFCCQEGQCDPHADYPMNLGFGATISEPWVHALALELLASRLKPGAVALDVGCGSGFMCAAMAKLIGSSEGGGVIGLEHVKPLAQQAITNIRRAVPEGQIQIVVRDGRMGCPEAGSFDAIHVGAAIDKNNMPVDLLEQLKPGGRMVYTEAVGSGVLYNGIQMGAQSLKYIDKDDDGELLPARDVGVRLRMVPLVSLEDQSARFGMSLGGASMSLLGGIRARLTPRVLREARLKRRLRGLQMPFSKACP